MKIGILTFHWALNYGAVLQCYALQSVLLNMGHQVEIIDYRPTWASDNRHPRFPHRLSEAIKFIDHYFRKHNFSSFRKKHMNISARSFKYGEIITGYDCVIVGSDQVFNPDIIGSGNRLDTSYLLEFVADGTKKIAYAASFGNSTLADKYSGIFKQRLSSYSAIGIREDSGTKILYGMGLNAANVPDPTILLGDFSALQASTSVSKETYNLNFIFQKTDAVRMAQLIISEESGERMYSIAGLYDKITQKDVFYNLTPQNWIFIISKANFVITDSFHTTVFCILNHRPFLCLILDAWGSDWSERMKALLARLGLQDRLIASPTPDMIRETYRKEIDWNSIDCKLAEWRNEGLRFLLNNLNG